MAARNIARRVKLSRFILKKESGVEERGMEELLSKVREEEEVRERTKKKKEQRVDIR